MSHLINKSYCSVNEARQVLKDHPDQLMKYLSSVFKNSLNSHKDDLLQDMYLACLEAVETYEPGRPLHCYMHQTAKFVLHRNYNKLKRDRRSHSEEDYDRNIFGYYESQSENKLIYNESVQILTNHIATLSSRDQKIIQLHLAGQTLQEIAKQVDLSFQRCHQILTNFKQMMKTKLFARS